MLETLVLTVLIPLIVGILSSKVMGALKKASEFVAGMNPWLQRGLVGLLATLASWLSSALGVPLPADLLNMPPEMVAGLLSTGFALLYHFIMKKVAPAPTA